jgi:aspartate aminotransferase
MDLRVSERAAHLVGSEILRIAAEVRAMVAAGADVCNLTVGDFDSSQFPIPAALLQGITEALRAGETNYPPSDGMPALRSAVVEMFRRRLGLEYPLESVLVTGGSRPGLYGAYGAVVDPGDFVVYPLPSWNNNHYVHLAGAQGRPVVCGPETGFLPTRESLEEPLRGARLLVINSPLNPTGTAFDAESLAGICDLVLEENARRGPGERPLYLLYDQVYWMLTFGGVKHVNPVSLRPAMADFTIFVDGTSKAFASTGLRVGWVVAPADRDAAHGEPAGARWRLGSARRAGGRRPLPGGRRRDGRVPGRLPRGPRRAASAAVRRHRRAARPRPPRGRHRPRGRHLPQRPLRPQRLPHPRRPHPRHRRRHPPLPA